MHPFLTVSRPDDEPTTPMQRRVDAFVIVAAIVVHIVAAGAALIGAGMLLARLFRHL